VKRAILVAAIALAGYALAVRLGLLADVMPKLGSEAWILARASGVMAFAALTLDVVFGLCVSTGVLDRAIPRGASVDVHRWLASVALAFVALHVVGLLLDSTVQFDALDALVPGLSSYRPGAVAVGVLAMYGTVVVDASFAWRKRIGVRAWRALHFVAFAVFAAAVAHGLAAGSDAGRLQLVYAGAAAIVVALVLVRVARSIMVRCGARSSS
jgi:methionine sulfoxide reductase heme-binding subunit